MSCPENEIILSPKLPGTYFPSIYPPEGVTVITEWWRCCCQWTCPFWDLLTLGTIISVDKYKVSARSLEKGWAWGPGWACGLTAHANRELFFNNSCYLVCSYTLKTKKKLCFLLCGFPEFCNLKRANLRKSERTGYTRFSCLWSLTQEIMLCLFLECGERFTAQW